MRVLSVDVPGRRIGGYVYAKDRLVVEYGSIIFDPARPARIDLKEFAGILLQHTADVIVLEMPFLHEIAGNVGAVRMWAALHDVSWWQVGASRAKKQVLGRGRASKAEVKQWANKIYPEMDQHQADALLYYHAWLLDSGRES